MPINRCFKVEKPLLGSVATIKSLKAVLICGQRYYAKTHECDSNRLLDCLEPQKVNKGN